MKLRWFTLRREFKHIPILSRHLHHHREWIFYRYGPLATGTSVVSPEGSSASSLVVSLATFCVGRGFFLVSNSTKLAIERVKNRTNSNGVATKLITAKGITNAKRVTAS